MMERAGAVSGAVSPERERRKLRKACEDFEALLTTRMLSAMREATALSEEPSHARGVYEAMLDQSVAEAMSQTGETGLAAMLFRSLEGRLAGAGEEAQGAAPGVRLQTIEGDARSHGHEGGGVGGNQAG